MKKLTFIIALMLMSIAGIAQEDTKTSPKIGIRMGYNQSNFCKLSDFCNEDGPFWKSAINFGVVTDFQLSEKFVLRPGVYYSMKGFQDNIFDLKFRRNYAELPLLAVFQKAIGDILKMEIQVGPYFALGIGGKSEWHADYKMEGNKVIPIIEKYDTFGESGEDPTRFDWGLNFGLGIHISKIYIGVAFEEGLRAHEHNHLNKCFMANLGYYL